MGDVITAEGLTKVYRGKVKAVDHISFQVQEGEIFGFLGPNGAGKTTTIKMLNTLASITDGRATVAGHDVAKEPGLVRKSIGVVPQELTADDELSGTENMLLMANLHQVWRSTANSRISSLLALVDLQDAASRKVKTYSGGMRRRLQLVMGLLHEPRVLFLDEPTLGLDVQTRTKMWQYIKQLNKEKGLTVFMTTHYLDEADSLCDRIAILDHGKMLALGSPAELKANHGAETVIAVTVVGDGARLREEAERIGSVRRAEVDGSIVRVFANPPDGVLVSLIESARSLGLEVRDASSQPPSLENVFLTLTGREYRE